MFILLLRCDHIGYTQLGTPHTSIVGRMTIIIMIVKVLMRVQNQSRRDNSKRIHAYIHIIAKMWPALVTLGLAEDWRFSLSVKCQNRCVSVENVDWQHTDTEYVSSGFVRVRRFELTDDRVCWDSRYKRMNNDQKKKKKKKRRRRRRRRRRTRRDLTPEINEWQLNKWKNHLSIMERISEWMSEWVSF